MIKLRTATVQDAPALAAIYEYYVNNTTVSFEYDAPSAAEFADRIAHKLEKYPYIVAEVDGRPVGYAYAAEYRDRRAYDNSVELSVYVDRDFRGGGVGSALYAALIGLLKLQNLAAAYACITYPNPPSIAFHEKKGFKLVGHFHRTGFKLGTWLDIVWYELLLSDGIAPPSPVIPFPLLDKTAVDAILSPQKA